MSKLVQRLLIFFVGLPLVLSLAYFSFYHHLILQIVILFVSITASIEMYNILKQKSAMQPLLLVTIASSLIPITAVFCVITEINLEYISFILVFSVIVCMVYEIFLYQKNNGIPDFSVSNSRISASILIFVYCGYLITFISRLSMLHGSRALLLIFILMVYGCDSFAWLFGMLFGKKNRGKIIVSPNKSIAGFIGGYAGSAAAGICGYFFFPDIFSGSIAKSIMLGIITATAAILGDLVESVFKRSGNIKDSGQVVPGRGGILDSTDSIILAAPVFYACIKLFFGL